MKTQIQTTLSLLVICCGVSIGFAADPPRSEQLPATGSNGPIVTFRKVYRNEPLADLGARLYDKVDYELQLRGLDRDIRIAEAELAQRRERVRVYDEYFGYQDAGLLTLQNARLDVVKSAEQLKFLRQAKLLALRHRNEQIRYRQLLLAEGAARLQIAE